MSSDIDSLESYCKLLRERQIALAKKLVASSGGPDPVTFAVKNAAGFVAIQSAINTARGIIGELKASS